LLSADARIVLIRIKVERAKKHLKDLAADVLATERRTVVIRDGDTQSVKSATDAVTFKFSQGLPSTDKFLNVPRFSADVLAGAGDVAHNLRTALDHLMCHLLLVAGSGITKRDCFPISEDIARYESRKAGIVNRVQPEVMEALDRLKPYKGGNEPLWRVHELDRIDKHRALFSFAHDFLFHADWLSGDFLFKKDAPDYAGLYDSQVEQDMQFEIEKSLSEPQIAGRDAVLPSLHQLIDVVEDVILSFKPSLEAQIKTPPLGRVAGGPRLAREKNSGS